MTLRATCVTAAALLVVLAAAPQRALAYSVLAHEALIDTAWDAQISPLLAKRFPGASAEAVRAARAYAYGGSLIQDLGYYPFGSRLFSNLVHYVRSGDFVGALLRESRDVDEYAFALGALAHYASDTIGHPVGTNRAVPLLYPKLGAKFGPEMIYADSPSRHLMAEFAFDVLQVARGAFKSDIYQRFLGFEVAAPLLDRAFQATYALSLDDVFGDVDQAISTYRHAASEMVPDVTRLAWRSKKDEILAANPALTEQDFVFAITREQYEKSYGSNYRKPGLLARVVVAIFKVIPKFGPFKPLAFEPLTPETERMFLDSFAGSRERYGELLQIVQSARPGVSDTDLDTGQPTVRGVNTLADETYAELLEELVARNFATVPPDLYRSINAHYAGGLPTPKPSKRDRKAAGHLAALNAAFNAGATQ